MKEIVFEIQLPRGARSNMCFVVRAVAEAIAVVVAGKHYMWVGQHLGVGNLIEEERGIVVRGLRTWANKLWVRMLLQLPQDIFRMSIVVGEVVAGIGIAAEGLVREEGVLAT
jgi:hypothetical protein